MKARLFLPATALTVLSLAATAQAQQRYAAPPPAGTGSKCTQAEPCLLQTAVAKAKSKDEVIVGTGAYSLDKGLEPEDFEVEGLFIHGDFAAPMPVITSSAPIEGGVLSVIGADAVLAWVDVRTSGQETAAIACFGGRVERVRAETTGYLGTAISGSHTCAVSDSLAVATGGEASAIGLYSLVDEQTGSVTNSTAIATGPGSNGIAASYVGVIVGGTYTVNVTNTIAQGAEADLLASGAGNEIADIAVSHSNFDKPVQSGTGTIVDKGGNQASPPQFVDAGAGNYAEALGSPTIDAGVATPAAGSLDLAGNPRTAGAAIDIGAYELIPPTAVSIPPPPPQPASTGRIVSIAITPPTFVAANIGEAQISGRKRKAPVGATVFYSLSGAGTVTFTAERKVPGRKVGGKCVKQTKANRSRRKCTLLRQAEGSFTDSGVAGANSFKFSGRIGGRTLAPGPYQLVGEAGGVTKRVAFTIVK